MLFVAFNLLQIFLLASVVSAESFFEYIFFKDFQLNTSKLTLLQSCLDGFISVNIVPNNNIHINKYPTH